MSHVRLLALHLVRLATLLSLHRICALLLGDLDFTAPVEHLSMLTKAEEQRIDALLQDLLLLLVRPRIDLVLKLRSNFRRTTIHQFFSQLVDKLAFGLLWQSLRLLLLLLHVLLLVLLALVEVGGTNIHAHGGSSLLHRDWRYLHRPLELSVWKPLTELLRGALLGRLQTSLTHHIHLARVHAIHRHVHVPKV